LGRTFLESDSEYEDYTSDSDDGSENILDKSCGEDASDEDFPGDQINTYYVTVSIYRTRQNSPTSQYVLFNMLSNIEPPPRRCTTARYVRLYIRKTSISPMYNGEVGASVHNED